MKMEIFIVYLRSANDGYEDAAVVVAEDTQQAIDAALEDCNMVVTRDGVECVRVCDDEPCVYWLI
jgi:hypothetical protein